jgi:hypothetical protein
MIKKKKKIQSLFIGKNNSSDKNEISIFNTTEMSTHLTFQLKNKIELSKRRIEIEEKRKTYMR